MSGEFSTGKRILLLDDQEGIRHFMTLVLRGAGYEVHAVEDGIYGIDAVEDSLKNNTPFHLYLSDVRMPRLDGPDFIERVRTEYGDMRTPSIFMTGAFRNDEQRNRVLNLNPFHILEKPFDNNEMVQVVGKAVSQNIDDVVRSTNISRTDNGLYVRQTEVYAMPR